MKTLIAVVSILAFVMVANPSDAQRFERFRGNRNFNDSEFPVRSQRAEELKLSDAQREKMQTIRIETEKQIKPYQDQMRELMARHQTLVTAEKPDMKAIEASLEQISKVQLQMAKIRAARHQEIRAQLTEEQRLMFDKRRGIMGRGEGFGAPRR